MDELVEQLSGITIMNWKSNLQKKRNLAPFSFRRLSFLSKSGEGRGDEGGKEACF